jgi:glycosyltransferase involved in cell wall biosynthesis
MKVLFFCISNTLGGAERFALRVVRAMNLDGHQAKIVTCSSGDFADALEHDQIPRLYTDIGPKLSTESIIGTLKRWRSFEREMRKIIDDEAPDRVILQFKLETLLFAATNLGEIKYSVLEHGRIPWQYIVFPWSRSRLKRVLSSAESAMAVSGNALKSFRGLGFTGVKIGAAIDDEFFDFRKLQTQPLSEPVFAYVGRLEPEKGIKSLLRVFEARKLEKAQLHIAGNGSLSSYVKRASETRSNVSFFGQVPSSLDMLAKADAAILLSVNEGRPLIVLEAVSIGVPVFGYSKNKALVEMREEFGEDLIVLSKSRRELVQKLSRFIPKTREPAEVPTWADISRLIVRG